MIDIYYTKGMQQRENDQVEEALTTFINGVEHGSAKCAYGVVDTVVNYLTYTITDEEAIDLFREAYPKLKLMAEGGDAEAMVMVGEGIRYGFVDDDDTPFGLWLAKAAALGNAHAIKIMLEVEQSDDPTMSLYAPDLITPEMCECVDDADLLLLDEPPEFDEDISTPEEHGLLEEADWFTLETYGVNARLQKRKHMLELLKSDHETLD